MIPTEYEEQVAFVQYLDLKGYKYTSIPNSTYTKSWNQKRRNAASGLHAGFPDLAVIAKGKFICIEMKRVKGGVVSKEQKAWIEALNEVGVSTKVCKGCEEAVAFIESL